MPSRQPDELFHERRPGYVLNASQELPLHRPNGPAVCSSRYIHIGYTQATKRVREKRGVYRRRCPEKQVKRARTSRTATLGRNAGNEFAITTLVGCDGLVDGVFVHRHQSLHRSNAAAQRTGPRNAAPAPAAAWKSAGSVRCSRLLVGSLILCSCSLCHHPRPQHCHRSLVPRAHAIRRLRRGSGIKVMMLTFEPEAFSPPDQTPPTGAGSLFGPVRTSGRF